MDAGVLAAKHWRWCGRDVVDMPLQPKKGRLERTDYSRPRCLAAGRGTKEFRRLSPGAANRHPASIRHRSSSTLPEHGATPIVICGFRPDARANIVIPFLPAAAVWDQDTRASHLPVR